MSGEYHLSRGYIRAGTSTDKMGCSAFLAVAAYLIFGSWLNYNKYGARGYVQLPV